MELINFKCTQCSGSVTFQEDSDIAVCDYCGAELRFKQEVEKSHNEHKSELDALSDRITDLIEDQKYIQAEQASKEGLLSYPWAGRLHLYMLMCEFELNHPDLLGTCGKDYTRSANYKKCIRYMTEEDRNDLLMLVEKNQSSPSYKTAEAAMASSEKPSNYWEAQLKENPNDPDAALLQKYATETNNRKANDEKTDDNDVRNQTNSSANTNQTVTPDSTSPNIENQEEPATKKKGSFFKSLLKELLK